MPPGNVCKEEIFSEFEMYFSQLQPLLPKSPEGKEKEEKLKANLSNLAHEYSEIQQDRRRFPLGTEQLSALNELRKNKEIVISRPDKGAGTVLMDKAGYIAKMMTILGDETEFECLGPCKDHDRTGQNERALQTFLLRQHKAGEITRMCTKESVRRVPCDREYMDCPRYTSRNRSLFDQFCQWRGARNMNLHDG